MQSLQPTTTSKASSAWTEEASNGRLLSMIQRRAKGTKSCKWTSPKSMKLTTKKSNHFGKLKPDRSLWLSKRQPFSDFSKMSILRKWKKFLSRSRLRCHIVFTQPSRRWKSIRISRIWVTSTQIANLLNNWIWFRTRWTFKVSEHSTPKRGRMLFKTPELKILRLMTCLPARLTKLFVQSFQACRGFRPLIWQPTTDTII